MDFDYTVLITGAAMLSLIAVALLGVGLWLGGRMAE